MNGYHRFGWVSVFGTLVEEKLEAERDRAVQQLQEQKNGEQHRFGLAVNRVTAEKDKTILLLQGTLKTGMEILNILADILYKASEVLKRVIGAIIHFATEQHKLFFSLRPKSLISKALCRSMGKQPNNKRRLVHGFAIMRNTDNHLMKSNIATHSKRLAMWQRESMIGKLKADKVLI